MHKVDWKKVVQGPTGKTVGDDGKTTPMWKIVAPVFSDLVKI